MHKFGMVGVIVAAAAFAAESRALADEPKGDSKADKLVGTWKLVSAKYGGQERKFPEGSTTIKHVTPVQMIWLTHDKDGKITRAGGGSYTLTGDEFTDTPEYGLGTSFDVVKGKTHKFKCKVEGNKWYHTGKLDSGLTIDEVWERVEKK
jgi:hypothetical protein